MNLDDCSTDELIEELARRFDSVVVVGKVETRMIVSLEGDSTNWCVLNAFLGSAIVNAADKESNENNDH